jgi:hypothetical protein
LVLFAQSQAQPADILSEGNWPPGLFHAMEQFLAGRAVEQMLFNPVAFRRSALPAQVLFQYRNRKVYIL